MRFRIKKFSFNGSTNDYNLFMGFKRFRTYIYNNVVFGVPNQTVFLDNKSIKKCKCLPIVIHIFDFEKLF